MIAMASMATAPTVPATIPQMADCRNMSTEASKPSGRLRSGTTEPGVGVGVEWAFNTMPTGIGVPTSGSGVSSGVGVDVVVGVVVLVGVAVGKRRGVAEAFGSWVFLGATVGMSTVAWRNSICT
jgi:hypothetical protein